MAVPKKKMSRSRTRQRKAAWKATVVKSSPCPQCGSAKLSHRVCPTCGSYKGREVTPTT
ncbi:MAG TPA: 50S ribosomal protein L32 [Acidimicrobiia bacterium]|nr:50S ribosomal protein L32 [Acidimicrobiia bacterium]